MGAYATIQSFSWSPSSPLVGTEVTLTIKVYIIDVPQEIGSFRIGLKYVDGATNTVTVVYGGHSYTLGRGNRHYSVIPFDPAAPGSVIEMEYKWTPAAVGSYTFEAFVTTYTTHEVPESSVQRTIGVGVPGKKQTSIVNFTVTPTRIIRGQTAVISGKLIDQDNLPIANAPIRIFFGSLMIGETMTDVNGEFTYNWTPEYVSPGYVYAGYSGSDTYYECQSELVYVTVTKIPTRITLTLSSDTVYVNTPITLTASLEYFDHERNIYVPFPNARVRFSLVSSKKSYRGEATTNANGIASVTFTPEAGDMYTAIALYPGDENYESSSDKKSVNVLRRPTVITLSVDRASAPVNTYVKLYGHLRESDTNSPITGRSVYLSIRAPSGNKLDTTVATGIDGYYEYYLSLTEIGTYMAGAIFTGDDVYDRSSSDVIRFDSIGATQEETVITIDIDKTRVKVGTTINIMGGLTTKAGYPLANKNVHIVINKDSVLYTTITATTNNNGLYSASWTPREPGTYQIKAVFVGDIEYKGSESNIETVEVLDRYPTKITVSVSNANPVINTPIDIYGSLVYIDDDGSTKPIPNGLVSIDIYKDGSMIYRTSDLTKPDGSYSVSYAFNEAGSYTIKVIFIGSDEYAPAESSTNVTVLSQVSESRGISHGISPLLIILGIGGLIALSMLRKRETEEVQNREVE